MTHHARLLLAGLLLFSASARADLNEVFDNAFGAMVNTTAPGAYAGSTRGILVGGSVEVRTKLTQAPSLLGITRPGIKAGCGGISIFGGSFSAINLDEFTEYLRSVMSNSLGYLFKIGIESICPSCAQVLDSLEQFVGKVNSVMKDSCQMGKLLADSSGLADAFKFEEANAFNEAVGSFSNTVDAFVKAVPSLETVSETTNDIDANETRKAFSGNIVYSALKKAGTATRFQATASATSQKRLLEYIQSLTGTIIYPIDGSGKVTPVELSPTITLKQLLGGPTLTTADKTPDIIVCDADPEDLCAEPTELADPTFLPMADRVAHILTGGSGQSARGLDNTPGIADRVRTDTALQPQEVSLLQSTRIPVMAMLIDARQYPSLVNTFADELTPLVAIDVLENAVSQILKEVDRALALKQLNSDDPRVETLRERLIQIKVEFNEETKKVRAKEDTMSNILAKHKLVRESLNGRTNLNLTPGANTANPG